MVESVSIAPAEKPIMPTFSGSTFHSFARSRTRANAAFASAIIGARVTEGSCVPAGRLAAPENIWRIDSSNSGMVAGVWFKRYFKTKAATPFAASALATFQPSFSIESVRNPPPGATITAAPVDLPVAGRNGVSVAMVTFRAKTLPY